MYGRAPVFDCAGDRAVGGALADQCSPSAATGGADRCGVEQFVGRDYMRYARNRSILDAERLPPRDFDCGCGFERFGIDL